MAARHVDRPLPARRKTARFHEEMVDLFSSICAILQHSKPCALDPIRIFGDRWSQLNTGLPNYKLQVVVSYFVQVSPPWAQPAAAEPTFKASQPYSPPPYQTTGYNSSQYQQQYTQQYNQAPVPYPAQLALPYGGSPVSPLSGGSSFQANESPFDPPSEEKQYERR
jgi:hypothetical protein